MDAKVVPVAPIARTCLIMRLRPPCITNASLLPIVLYLLDMHHQPGEVHVIVEHRRPTILQISVDSCEEPSHLIPVVR